MIVQDSQGHRLDGAKTLQKNEINYLSLNLVFSPYFEKNTPTVAVATPYVQ